VAGAVDVWANALDETKASATVAMISLRISKISVFL
jgi:hypothetical protein